MQSTSPTSNDRRDHLDHEHGRRHWWHASPAILGPRQLVILGPPGAGKGTQSKRLARRFGLVHVSTGDLLRAGPKLSSPARPYMQRGELVPDSVILDLLAARLAEEDVQRHGFVLDGFPRTREQARALDALLAPGCIDRVIELVVDADTVRPRLHRRGREDDTPATIERRFATHERETAEISRWYEARRLLLRVDGRPAVDTVTARLLRHLDGAATRAPNTDRRLTPALEYETIE